MNHRTPPDPRSLRRAAIEALHRSEDARRRAKDRKAEIRVQTTYDLQKQADARRPWWQVLFRIPAKVPASMIRTTTDYLASQDPIWKAAVADEQWYHRQNTNYALSTLVSEIPDDELDPADDPYETGLPRVIDPYGVW